MEADSGLPMNVVMLATIAAFLLLMGCLIWVIVLLRAPRGDAARLDATLREELRIAREEAANQARRRRSAAAMKRWSARSARSVPTRRHCWTV
jgi:hypothetical protein